MPLKPVLEPGVQNFVNSLANAPAIYTLSPQQARNVLRDAQKQPSLELPEVDIEDRNIPGEKLGDISVRIYRPKGSSELLPTVLYIHGGGWVLGDRDTHDRLLRDLTVGTEAAFVFVNYTPSPEAQFPTAIEQAYAAARWIEREGESANLDGKNLLIAGDSVGGNMVAAVTLLAKQRGSPKLQAQLLFYPVTDASFSTGSYKEFADGPWLTKEAMKWFWDQYLPDKEARTSILASPLRAAPEDLKGLPPALIIVDENDVLRDEGEAYARKLEQAGVNVAASRYLGTIHDFVMLNGIAETNATRDAITHATAWLRERLYPN